MTRTATNRVVAEFYHGIDFPPGWAAHPTRSIGIGLARDLVFAIIVLLDAGAHPLAACWQVAVEGEKFIRTPSGQDIRDDLLDEANADMARQSKRATSDPGLFATMLWEPRGLRPDQGIDVHPPRTGSFFDPIAEEPGWNVATRELVAEASNLLLVRRQNTTGLSLPVPSSAAEMHVQPDRGQNATFVVLPAAWATRRQ